MAERKSTKTTKRLATCAALTSLALIFSYVEFLIPISLGIPGIKLGLANIVVLISIYTLGPKYGLFINLARIALSALLFGNGRQRKKLHIFGILLKKLSGHLKLSEDISA